jgi:hypothetical protein
MNSEVCSLDEIIPLATRSPNRVHGSPVQYSRRSGTCGTGVGTDSRRFKSSDFVRSGHLPSSLAAVDE